METIIGREYIPTDNSYAICLSDNITLLIDILTDNINGYVKRYLLHGCNHNNQIDTICTILTNSFDVSIDTILGKQLNKFVIVKDPSDNIHFVLYNQRGLIPTPYINGE